MELIRGLQCLPQPPVVGLLTGNIRLGAEIKLRRFGLWGVAAGTALPVIAANFLITVPVGCRQVGLPLGQFVRLIGRTPSYLATVRPGVRRAQVPESTWPT